MNMWILHFITIELYVHFHDFKITFPKISVSIASLSFQNKWILELNCTDIRTQKYFNLTSLPKTFERYKCFQRQMFYKNMLILHFFCTYLKVTAEKHIIGFNLYT